MRERTFSGILTALLSSIVKAIDVFAIFGFIFAKWFGLVIHFVASYFQKNGIQFENKFFAHKLLSKTRETGLKEIKNGSKVCGLSTTACYASQFLVASYPDSCRV